jgi:ribosome biogenesis GTPase
MWTDEATLRERFYDISKLAEQCKFHDCKHGTDAGCAVRAAMAAGKMNASRFEGFQKLEVEIEALRLSRKKRAMTGERVARREQQKKARRFTERAGRDNDHEPRWRGER